MSTQTVDTAFLKGMKNEELKTLIANGDERVKKILADPELKRDLYSGKLFKADDKPAETPPAPTPPPAPPAPAEVPLWKQMGYDSQEALIKNVNDMKNYQKTLETRVNELNARAGAEGGPLGNKIKAISEELEMTKRELAEVKRTPQPAQPELSGQQILDLYDPDFADDIKPENFADPEAAKLVKKQQLEFKRAWTDLKTKITRLSPANTNKQLADLMKRHEDLQAKYELLAQKDEMREARLHDEESQNSFNSIYAEADAFIRRLGITPTRHFADIDRAIAASGEVGSDSRTMFLKSLPDADRIAWETAIPYINRYGRVVEQPVNGGRAKVVRFEKYGNVESLDDLYNLELLKSGKLDEKKRQEILAAHKQGAQSVIAAAQLPPGVKGIPDNAAAGEHLPVESTLEEKTARLKVLMGMGQNLLKDPKAHAEYKALKAEVYGTVRQQMAQGKFKRKR